MKEYRCLHSLNNTVVLFKVIARTQTLECGAAYFFGALEGYAKIYDIDNKNGEEICLIKVPENISSATYIRQTSMYNNLKIPIFNNTTD